MIDFTKKISPKNIEYDWERITIHSPMESRGYSPNKTWFQNKSNPNQIALFKPDTGVNNCECELKSAKTAASMNLRCAVTEIVSYKDQKGTLSHNFQHPDKLYIPAVQYIFNSIPRYIRVNRDYNSSEEHQNHFQSFVSMDVIRSHTPEIEHKFVNMLAFDCLTQNQDRHGRNVEIEIDTNGQNIDLVLFDHGMSFGWAPQEIIDSLKAKTELSDDEARELITPDLLDDTCWTTWNRNEKISHLDMFARLSADYPIQICGILKKAAGNPNLDDFCKERLSLMQEIYEQNKNAEPNNNREAIIAARTHPINPDRFTSVDDLLFDANATKSNDFQFGDD